VSYDKDRIERAITVLKGLRKTNPEFASTAAMIDAFNIAIHYLTRKGQWVHDGHVPIPKNRAEAEMMHLISENWLKSNPTSESKSDGD